MQTKHKYTLFTGAGLLACFLALHPAAIAQTQSLDELSALLGIDASATLCVEQTSRARTAGMTDGSAALSAEQMDHSHIPIAVPQGAPAPRLSLTLTPDVMSGFNLKLYTQDYDLTPPPADAADMEALMPPAVNPQSGYAQGHAHLYINGEKIQRVYGHDLHLPGSLFKAGMNQLNVTLNNHAHMYWTVDDKQVISSIFINNGGPQLVLYQFDSFAAKKS